MNDEKIHLKCGYTYLKKGKEISATYISPKINNNLDYTNPNVIANELVNEILVETGRAIKSFTFVGKEPIKH